MKFCFISRSNQYILLNSQHQIAPNGYATITDSQQFLRKVIPPPIETLKPDKEPEKLETIDKEITIKDELQPSNPFYYVVPPGSQLIYYNPQIQTM